MRHFFSASMCSSARAKDVWEETQELRAASAGADGGTPNSTQPPSNSSIHMSLATWTRQVLDMEKKSKRTDGRTSERRTHRGLTPGG